MHSLLPRPFSSVLLYETKGAAVTSTCGNLLHSTHTVTVLCGKTWKEDFTPAKMVARLSNTVWKPAVYLNVKCASLWTVIQLLLLLILTHENTKRDTHFNNSARLTLFWTDLIKHSNSVWRVSPTVVNAARLWFVKQYVRVQMHKWH